MTDGDQDAIAIRESMMTEKWVRVMADYCSDGLWDKEGVMMERDTLPITPTLAARHEAWCLLYEQSEPFRDGGAVFDYTAFSEEGRQIARAIKRELPDWTVMYFDESKIDRSRLEDQSRNEFEYEIHVPTKEGAKRLASHVKMRSACGSIWLMGDHYLVRVHQMGGRWCSDVGYPEEWEGVSVEWNFDPPKIIAA